MQVENYERVSGTVYNNFGATLKAALVMQR